LEEGLAVGNRCFGRIRKVRLGEQGASGQHQDQDDGGGSEPSGARHGFSLFGMG
jgi:hypothetical protein